MNKKKVFKVILIVLLILFLLFVINTVRKIIIIKNLQSKVSQYMDSTNCYMKSTSKAEETTTIETYRKDDKSLTKLNVVLPNGTRNLISYTDGEIKNVYIDVDTNTSKSKVAMLNTEGIVMTSSILDWLYTENFGQLILMAITSNIKSETLNGIDCYIVNGFHVANMLTSDFNVPGYYIEKETGLVIRNSDGVITKEDGTSSVVIVDREYKFDVVTDEDLVEPDISEYTIKENN